MPLTRTLCTGKLRRIKMQSPHMGGEAHLRSVNLFARLCAAFVGDEGQVRRPCCQLGLPVGQQ